VTSVFMELVVPHEKALGSKAALSVIAEDLVGMGLKYL
jgi:hypothetical protein